MKRISFNIHTRIFSPSMTPMEAMQKVQRDLDGEFLYGAVVGTDFYSPEAYPGSRPWDEVPWDRYRVRKLKDIVKDKRGTCLEYTKYAHFMLDKYGVPNRTFMVLSDDGGMSHTFVVAYDGDSAYWLESANWKHHGIHKINSISDVGDTLANHYTVFEFDQDKVADKDMGGDKYIEWIKKQKKVLHR